VPKAYAVLRKDGAIRLDLRRGGKPMSLTYELRRAFSGAGEPVDPAASSDVDAGPSAAKLVPDEIRRGITKVSSTSYQLKRSTVDAILQDPTRLMRAARIVPQHERDRIVGIRVFSIRSGSLLHLLGFENGDLLETINGYELSDPSKALEGYQKLRGTKQLTVAIERKGKPISLEYRIVD
jgi:general secretion pathway protein C